MFLVIDSFDSYVHNLSSSIMESGHDVTVIREDRVSADAVRSLSPAGIVLSPGPGRPSPATASWKIAEEFSGIIPLLGVCLGHQTVCSVFGADIVHGKGPVHGKVAPVIHNGKGLFLGLPDVIAATRYNSLSADPASIPECIRVDAVDGRGDIMAVSHKEHRTYGVQFHPESFMTVHGDDIIRNFIRLAEGRP